MEPVPTEAGGAVTSTGEVIKERVRQMYSRSAEAYVTSPSHATGEDLAELLILAAPQPGDRALDISTGGGHTALAIAPHVREVFASDLTPRILQAAREFIAAKGVGNIFYVIADAERLPFLDASFDLVTVRIAPHHYADIQAAISEMARVLLPAGRLVVIDNIAPEDPLLDRYLNEWERRRDPSHVRAYTSTEWRSFLSLAGLQVHELRVNQKAYDFDSWAERMRMPEAERQQLVSDILAAPTPVRDYFKVQEESGHLTSWSVDYLTVLAGK
jgi:ubiquinone/menaquinone biosynthesis C-methylase UbiE